MCTLHSSTCCKISMGENMYNLSSELLDLTLSSTATIMQCMADDLIGSK